MERVYCCIDLKSFFASVECVNRGLDPFFCNLAVADSTRGRGTICLAITPAMKKLGIKNRCRVFEIPKNIDYMIARPRMKLYMETSAKIYSIYLKYVSPEDIHVYSIDECFIDLSDYTKLYGQSAHTLAKRMIEDIYRETGIRATVGIGTNLFLAKVALDITAKHSKDFMGFLDIDEFQKTIWHYRPITDVWSIGRGIAKRLEKHGIYDLYGLAHYDEDKLYKEFGINAELLIDHAHGIEPCTIKDIHDYKSKTNSLSNGQVLFSDYNYDDALVILKEMVDGLILELVENGLVTNNISLLIGYADRETWSGGSIKLKSYTNSYKVLVKKFEEYYRSTTLKDMLIRRINIGLNNIIKEEYKVYDIFTNVENDEKENELQKTVLKIKSAYGKNALLKGISYQDKATARERNKMIGGHRSGEN